MKLIFLAVFVILLIPLTSAFATVQSVSTDKSSYVDGEQVYVTGGVEYDDVYPPFAVIQVFPPGGGSFAHFDQYTVNSDGTFSGSFVAGGQLWYTDGTYTITISYGGDKLSKTIDYTTPEPEPVPISEQTPEQMPEPITETNPQPINEPTPEPKVTVSPTVVYLKEKIAGFPALDKSPQYYIDRYNTESSYKDWFDSQFPSNTIVEVVGYEKTNVDGFPALDKPPQYYIDRYNTESSYKDWFDSQFPNSSIYNVMGYSDPTPIPEWIKSNAEWWSQGNISDDAFVAGIEFMIDERIIVIPDLPESGPSSSDDVPNWVRNTASWWATEKISEDEFVNALKFLIKEGIISVS